VLDPYANWADRVYEWACIDMHSGRQCFWRGVMVGGSVVLLIAGIVAWSIAVAVTR